MSKPIEFDRIKNTSLRNDAQWSIIDTLDLTNLGASKMALHSDETHTPDLRWVDELSAEKRAEMLARMAQRAEAAKKQRAADEAAHVAAIHAIDLSCATIAAQIGYDGQLGDWSINGVYLDSSLMPVYRDWQGYDAVLQHCKDWAKANRNQFIANCVKNGGKITAFLFKENGVKL